MTRGIEGYMKTSILSINYAHPMPNPRERNQGAEYVMCILGGVRL